MRESRYMVFKKKISGFNTLGLLILMGVMANLPVNAQDYACRLTWSATPKTMVVAGDKKITQPTFTKAAHLAQYGMLPVYNQIVPLNTAGQVSVQLLNPVYASVTNIDNASVKYIKGTPIVNGGLTYYKKQPKAFLSVLPFRKNPVSGVMEKLESFTLRVTVTPSAGRAKSLTYAANSVLSTGTWYKL